MSRRDPHDVVVVGGGVVGAACALALAQAGLDTCLVESRRPPHWSRDTPDLRVYALAPDNAALLDSLGAWRAVRSEEHTSELQSRENLVCRLLLEKKKNK